jgi:hypothetical protein
MTIIPPDAQVSVETSLAARLARAFSLIALDLCNPWDESTDRFHPFHAPFADALSPDAQSLREPLSIGGRYHLDVMELDFGTVTSEAEGDAAVGYRLLDAVMHAALTDLRLVFARAEGVVRVRVWLLGRLPGHGLVGLRTESTET